MANKTICMSKLRRILKLYQRGVSKKRIARVLDMSRNTVKAYLERFAALNTTADELLKLSEYELNRVFHPPTESVVNPKLKELYDYFPLVEKEMSRRGMTLALQYKRFNELHPDGFKETAFYRYYGLWKKKITPVMHIEHKVGEMTYVDYAGGTLPYVDKDTGEIKQAQVFVAILGWSQYAYVEALRSQEVAEFIAGCENAFRHFGGVTEAIMPDNLKSAVIKTHRYEPVINVNFKLFCDHYGCSVVPARVRKPKDKSHVENMVKIAYQRLYARLNPEELMSLEDLNKELKRLLEESNQTPLTGKQVSRHDQLELERPALLPLPERGYELRTIKQVTVMKNGHVYLHEDQHYYSVPFELIGKKLKLQYSRTCVDLYDNYELIASHKRIRSPHNYTTDPQHMPPQHRIVTEWSPSYFLEKAKAIDPLVELYIREILAKKQHPTQGYRSCQGILNLGRRLGNARLINACKRAHEIGYYNYKTVEDILVKGLDKYEEDAIIPSMPAHGNIRGSDYYQ